MAASAPPPSAAAASGARSGAMCASGIAPPNHRVRATMPALLGSVTHFALRSLRRIAAVASLGALSAARERALRRGVLLRWYRYARLRRLRTAAAWARWARQAAAGAPRRRRARRLLAVYLRGLYLQWAQWLSCRRAARSPPGAMLDRPAKQRPGALPPGPAEERGSQRAPGSAGTRGRLGAPGEAVQRAERAARDAVTADEWNELRVLLTAAGADRGALESRCAARAAEESAQRAAAEAGAAAARLAAVQAELQRLGADPPQRSCALRKPVMRLCDDAGGGAAELRAALSEAARWRHRALSAEGAARGARERCRRLEQELAVLGARAARAAARERGARAALARERKAAALSAAPPLRQADGQQPLRPGLAELAKRAPRGAGECRAAAPAAPRGLSVCTELQCVRTPLDAARLVLHGCGVQLLCVRWPVIISPPPTIVCNLAAVLRRALRNGAQVGAAGGLRALLHLLRAPRGGLLPWEPTVHAAEAVPPAIDAGGFALMQVGRRAAAPVAGTGSAEPREVSGTEPRVGSDGPLLLRLGDAGGARGHLPAIVPDLLQTLFGVSPAAPPAPAEELRIVARQGVADTLQRAGAPLLARERLGAAALEPIRGNAHRASVECPAAPHSSGSSCSSERGSFSSGSDGGPPPLLCSAGGEPAALPPPPAPAPHGRLWIHTEPWAPPAQHVAPGGNREPSPWAQPAPLSPSPAAQPGPALPQQQQQQQQEMPAPPALLQAGAWAPCPGDPWVWGPADSAQLDSPRSAEQRAWDPERRLAAATDALARAMEDLAACQRRADALEARALTAEQGLADVGGWSAQLQAEYMDWRRQAEQYEAELSRMQEHQRQQQAILPPCPWARGQRLVYKGRGGEGVVYEAEGGAGSQVFKYFTDSRGVREEIRTAISVMHLQHPWRKHLVLPTGSYEAACSCSAGSHVCMTYPCYDGDLVTAAAELNLSIVDALVACRAVLRGAKLLHAVGGAHGDVKPQNALARWRQSGSLDDVALGDVGGSHQTAAWLPADSIGCAPAPSTDVYSAALLFIDLATGCPGPLPQGRRDAAGVRAALQVMRVPPGAPRAWVIERAVAFAVNILGRAPHERLDAAAALASIGDLVTQLAQPP